MCLRLPVANWQTVAVSLVAVPVPVALCHPPPAATASGTGSAWPASCQFFFFFVFLFFLFFFFFFPRIQDVKQKESALAMPLIGADAELFEGAMQGDEEKISEALAAGADVDVCNEPAGLCALAVLAGGGPGGSAALRTLLSAGARQQVDAEGWHPLLYASSGGVLSLLEPLVADVLMRGPRGLLDAPAASGRAWTPLTRAAYRGHAHAVRVLLHAGAAPDVLTDGRDARDWASSAGHEAVVSLLNEEAAAARGGEGASGARAAPISS